MVKFNASCPHCEKEFKLDRMGFEPREFIQCPHCRRVIKLEADDPGRKAIPIGPDVVDGCLMPDR